MPRARLLAGALLVALASAFGSIGLGSPAQAHNYLVSSTPAADSTLTELPDTFDITTNDALLDVGGEAGAFAFQVLDADGLYYGDGCVTVAGSTMTATPSLGSPGAYTVRWQVLSADGHTVSDEFAFTWAPTSATDQATGNATAPVCGQASPAASASPSESSSPPESAGPSESVAPSSQPSADGTPENASSDDTLPTVLWIGVVVIALAAAVVITLLITGRKKST